MDDKNTPKDPTPEDVHPVVDAIASIFAAIVVASLLFGLFHLSMFMFAVMYRLSVHFNYLP